MASWESDQLVVVMKQGNACGAKGLAGRPRSRDTSSGLRTGQRKSTKLDSMTYSTEGEEVVLKSRMREICKSGSVRGLVVDSPKGLATRPTRPILNSIPVKAGRGSDSIAECQLAARGGRELTSARMRQIRIIRPRRPFGLSACSLRR